MPRPTLARGKGQAMIPAGDAVIVEVPCGSDHGEPRARVRPAVARDAAHGLVASVAAVRDYGFES